MTNEEPLVNSVPALARSRLVPAGPLQWSMSLEVLRFAEWAKSSHPRARPAGPPHVLPCPNKRGAVSKFERTELILAQLMLLILNINIVRLRCAVLDQFLITC